MSNDKKLFTQIHLTSLADTDRIAFELSKIVKRGDILLFVGEIGAGKTTFIQSLAKYLEIGEEITSPTFVIQRLHENDSYLLSHVDLYRLNSDVEVESIGFEEYYDDAITVIEWADRYSAFQPPYLYLNFEYGVQEEERFLTISYCGEEWEKRLETFPCLQAD